MTEQSIIFFDIDGTLLDFNKELPATTKIAVQELKRKGHMVAIATGRGPFMYQKLREELGIDSFVSYNGQYVVVDGEVVYENPLSKPSLERLTIQALENNHPVVFLDPDEMKANVANHPFIQESMATLKAGFPTFDPEYYQENVIYQSLLFCETGDEAFYEEAFPAFDFVRWHPLSVDVLPKGGSKAKGIEKLLEKVQIPKERQYAFGDGLNDVEMLSFIPNSIAMGNGVTEAKAAAKYITNPVDEDGILHGLKMVGLL